MIEELAVILVLPGTTVPAEEPPTVAVSAVSATHKGTILASEAYCSHLFASDVRSQTLKSSS